MLIPATLGFHQYGLDANRLRQNSSAYDPQAEQVKDAQLFLEQGVDSSFTDIMFKADTTDMWYPKTDELLGAKVIHQIVHQADKSLTQP